MFGSEIHPNVAYIICSGVWGAAKGELTLRQTWWIGAGMRGPWIYKTLVRQAAQ